MTNSFDELARADCLFVIGSNTTVAHPMVGMRLMRGHREGHTLIVADPRRTDLARLADIHLRLRPGTDVPLINGLMHIIFENGWHDAAFIAERTENFDELRESLRQWTPEHTEDITGVPRDLLFRAAECYARSGTSAIVYCLGITLRGEQCPLPGQPGHALRSDRPSEHRCESAARPEQRAGRL